MTKMNRKRQIVIIIAVCVSLLLAVLLAAGQYLFKTHAKESPIYLAVSAYQKGTQGWTEPTDSYQDNTGEAIFLEGMEAFADEEYKCAQELFEKAVALKYSDPALPTYIYYYIDQCKKRQGVEADPDIVAKALKSAGEYALLANDTDMLWELVSGISQPVGSDEDAIELLKDYENNTDTLELPTWAWVENYIAMLEYNNKEYAKSIRGFYDVEVALADAELTSEGKVELRYAREYIANIYFIFEDYEEAAQRYQQLVEDTKDDADFHAYGCCLNMASAYLENGDTQNAEKAVILLEENLDRVDDALVPEIEATANDIRANICITEGDYKRAERYINKAENFYAENTDSEVFLGGEYYIALTRCKLLYHTGSIMDAQQVLEKMIDGGEAAYYGLENDIYDLLKEIYEDTGQEEKLVAIQEEMLELDHEFTRTIQREYLEFSEYYMENNYLRDANMRLSVAYMRAFLGIIAVLIVLVIVLLIVRLLRTKNLTDQLTGVYNRKMLMQLMRKYKRKGSPENLGIVMMDIDYFKRYNDMYGHPAGDVVLKKVAEVLQGCVRGKDYVIRYGGEEFLVILNDVKAHIAESVCDRIHKEMASLGLPHEGSDAADHVTFSMGLCYQEKANSKPMEQLIDTADQCLYRSKEAGRNRTTVQEINI